MVIQKFNVEWSSTCKTKDYFYVGQVKKYTKVWLCGSSVPSTFSALKSKSDTMVVKFHSNGSKRKSGVKVLLTATGQALKNFLKVLNKFIQNIQKIPKNINHKLLKPTKSVYLVDKLRIKVEN